MEIDILETPQVHTWSVVNGAVQFSEQDGGISLMGIWGRLCRGDKAEIIIDSHKNSKKVRKIVLGFFIVGLAID